MLGFRLLVYLFDDRFEDSEYAIALAGNSVQKVLTPMILHSLTFFFLI